MTPTCSQGACGTVTTTQNDAAGCARNVDGTACGSNVVCSGGNCVCGPNACGPNNCGGCGAGDYCDPGGHCQCAPRACDNVYCGPDGCGGTCECDGANGQQCMDDTTQSSCCYVSGHYCTFGDPCCNGACNFAASSCP
jgi:hypothetical protein